MGSGRAWARRRRNFPAAIVRSLVAAAKLNDIEPYVYLRDVLERMVDGHPVNRLDDLLPWNWTPTPVNP